MKLGGLAGVERLTLLVSICGAMVLPPPVAYASGDGPPVDPGPFVRGTVGIEFGVGLLDEAWNLNGTRKWLVDGRLSVWWACRNRTTLVVDLHATRVFQQASRTAFVTGVTPGMRVQIVRGEPWAAFAEIGVGPSWSDTVVPPQGTRFNYIGHLGVGLSRRLGRQVHGVGGFRWLHLSNNGREGPHRNPDIQALGGYAGVNVGF